MTTGPRPKTEREIRRGILKTLVGIACLIGLSLALFVYKMTSPRIMTPKELVNNGAITYQEPKTIPPFELIAHGGEPFTNDAVSGRWTLLFFGFTHCPDFCPNTLVILKSFVEQLDEAMREQLQVVMVSVDPARDTPERMADYMAGFNKDFIGVTGDFVRIKLLADQLYIPFHREPATSTQGSHAGSAGHGDHDNGAHDNTPHNNTPHNNASHYNVAHGENIVLIDPRGHYYGFFKPPFTLARLKATYRSIVTTYEERE